MTLSPIASDFEAGLRSWIAQGAGLDSSLVQPANTGQPAPIVPYATMLLVVPGPRGRTWDRRTINADGDVDIVTYQRVIDRYSVQFFRDGARDMARQFGIWAMSEEGRAASKRVAHPFSLVQVATISQIDDIISEQFEGRAGVQVDIGYQQTISQTISTWDSAEIILTEDTLTENITV